MLPEIRKSFGAFYTPPDVAEFLTRWAVRTCTDVVLDPSAGDGVFLRAVRQRIIEFGGTVATQVQGIELSRETYNSTRTSFETTDKRPRLIHGDFFDQSPSQFGMVTAIVGNPPFIRYQRFAGDMRQRALRRALEAGVELSELSSSWAPFLVHATTFIEPDGRMAVVAPAELVHAVYAKPVVEHLKASFGRVRLLVFERKLFADLSEDTVLVLAEGRGQKAERLEVHSVYDASSLHSWTPETNRESESPSGWSKGVARFVEHFIPSVTRDLYRELGSSSPAVIKLGDVASVGIGYVTGNNDFFHLSDSEANELRIPSRFLRRAVRNARSIKGLSFKKADWEEQSKEGARNLLLHIAGSQRALPKSVSKYLSKGKRAGVHQSYKCRMRDPWYAVPHVHVGDAFLSYMSSNHPKLFVNNAKAVAPNTLHVVRLASSAPIAPDALAIAWCSSLTNLSCEIEGHAMGGGMLKLEPRESSRVLIPALSSPSEMTSSFDELARTCGHVVLQEEVDTMVARTNGMSKRDLARLREATAILRERRTKR